MKVFIQALEQNQNLEELKKLIPDERLKNLEGKGILQAYTLAHEGTSRPKVLGEGSQVLKWPRAVIKGLAEKIKQGTKFFLGHGLTNDNDGRESVGEVIASFVKEISGKLSHIIVGHFPSIEKVKEMDVCSMEADVYTDDENIVGDINNVSGIALGSSNSENPAFPGALRLGVIQCFVKLEGDKNQGNKEKNMPLTFEEVKQAVRTMNIHPWQLYELDDLKNDRQFSKIFTENEVLKNQNKTLKEDSEKIKNESEKAVRTMNVGEAKGRLNKLMEDGYTEKQKTFILGRFDPEKMEELEEDDLKKFLESSKKEFADTAKLFGDSSAKIEQTKKEEEKNLQDLTPEDEALKLMGVID